MSDPSNDSLGQPPREPGSGPGPTRTPSSWLPVEEPVTEVHRTVPPAPDQLEPAPIASEPESPVTPTPATEPVEDSAEPPSEPATSSAPEPAAAAPEPPTPEPSAPEAAAPLLPAASEPAVPEPVTVAPQAPVPQPPAAIAPPPPPPPSGPGPTGPAATLSALLDRPEVAIGLAFAAGFLLARILKRLGR